MNARGYEYIKFKQSQMSNIKQALPDDEDEYLMTDEYENLLADLYLETEDQPETRGEVKQ